MTRVHGLLLIVLLTTLAPWLRAGEAVVHAVLFYSPTCPHCHKVIEEHLIPLQEKYGERLAILGINIFRPEGRRLYAKAMGHFGIPDEDRGVPALIVGTALLQGDREIPESFPGIVNQGLILGGIDWPLIAGLQQLLEAQGLVAPAAKAAEAVEPTSSPAVDKSTAEHDLQKALRARPTLADKWARDPVGNSLALAVLAGMLFSIVFLGYRATLPTARPIPWPRWSIPALLPIGLGVAAYLSFVEVNQVAAVCGPVGDCNAVQQSSYAILFGVIPIAVLGLVAYVAIGLAWILQYFGPQRWRRLGVLATLGLTLGGTLFSIYLTFLEPFVIGATCLWCLTSAIIMTLMLWAATGSHERASASTRAGS
jgi:uncharacterized membrane protein/thiol-disulfide isomerase/thioredoxin